MQSIEVGRKPLSERQREIYEWILLKTKKDGFQPSIREIAEEFGIGSPNGVVCHLKGMQRKGYINLGESHSRSIRFLVRPDGKEFKGFELA